MLGDGQEHAVAAKHLATACVVDRRNLDALIADHRPAERRIEPGDLYGTMRIMAEDFGHPAHLGRAGDPAEVGPVIAFVASRVNTYMTGADINVDGGSDF